MGVESFSLSLDSDVEVGSTGNIYRSPVLPTESAAYQSAAYQDEGVGSELERLVEALPSCESAENLAAVIKGSALETVEDAIFFQPEPQRSQLTQWLEVLNQPVRKVEPQPLKVRSWEWSKLPLVKSVLCWIDRPEQVRVLEIDSSGFCLVRSLLSGLTTNTHVCQLTPVSG
jgi:hypothetical protein